MEKLSSFPTFKSCRLAPALPFEDRFPTSTFATHTAARVLGDINLYDINSHGHAETIRKQRSYRPECLVQAPICIALCIIDNASPETEHFAKEYP
ncbi:hypothetical protein H1R20_g3137, partial [Candolleomyces eurysporus]